MLLFKCNIPVIPHLQIFKYSFLNLELCVKFCSYWNKEIKYHICCTMSTIDSLMNQFERQKEPPFFRDIRNLMTPNNTLNIMEITLAQGTVENPKSHALQWLRKKRRIKCNKVGGYIVWYNFNFFRTESTVRDRFLYALAATYLPCLATNSFFKILKIKFK